MQALRYQRKGLLEQAFDQYRSILVDDPKHVNSVMNCGIVLYLMGDLPRALTTLEKAIDLDPENADARYNHARVLAASDRHQEALDQFEQSLKFNPGDSLTIQQIGRICLKLGRFEQFFLIVNAGLEAHPYDADLYLLKAEAHLRKGDHGRATDLLNLLLRNDPTLEGALVLLSEAYLQLQKIDKAVTCLKRALLKNPGSAQLHKQLGICYGARGDRELARGEFSRAREIDPSLIVTVEEQGQICEEKPERWDTLKFQSYILARSDYYARSGAWRTAINEFLLLARKYPDRPIIWQELASAYQNAGEYRRAYTIYRRVLEMEPQNLEVQLQLSRLALTIGHIADARRYSEETAASYPGVSEVAEIQGQVHLKAGDVEAAKTAFRRAIEQSPANLEALIGLGTCHFKAEEFMEARDVWEQANKAFPSSIQIALNLAEANVELGQRVAAIKLLRETKALIGQAGLLIRPSNGERSRPAPETAPIAGSPIDLLHRLGSLYLESGWPKKARAEWRELLQLWNGDPRLGVRVLEALIYFREVREGLRLIRTYLKRHTSNPEIDFLVTLCHAMQKDQTKFWISWQKVWKERPDLIEQRANYLKAVLNRSDVHFLLSQMHRTQTLFSGFPETMQRITGLEEYLLRIQAIEPVTELNPGG